LVTFRWWNDIWLSEAFATYFTFVGANSTVPEFVPFERTGMDASQLGLEFDGGLGAVPIRPSDDTVLYIPPSQIVYQKGSSLIRMMQCFLTEDTLQAGLRTYLKEK
jgi:aminopeptidase N